MPSRTSGRWLMQVPWFERMNFGMWYSSSEPSAGAHCDVVAVDGLDGTGALGGDDLTGVDRGAVLHAGTDQRRRRTQQRNGLALHVRAHEGAVCVVVLEERDERGGDRHHLARRDVHVVDVGRDLLVRLTEVAVGAHDATQDLVPDELAGLGVEELVRLSDDVLLFFVSRQEVDVVGDLALDHAAVRRLDEAVAVDARERRERADQADVRAFRRLDRAHAAVVAGVHVADFEAGTLT